MQCRGGTIHKHTAMKSANDMQSPQPRIAAMIPCHNEALAIRQVIEELRDSLPEAHIYVFDNNSSDDTSAIANACGARVRHLPAYPEKVKAAMPK